MEEIKFIVDHLNLPPFNKRLRMIDFDEFSQIELVELLNEVFSKMDEEMGVDVRSEEDEVRGLRMMNFLHILKFQMPQGDHREMFKRGLIFGDRTIIYPVLFWLLQKFESLCKRAYLAKFLLPVDIPPDFIQDERVSSLHQRMLALQGDFKEIHKQVENQRKSGIQPNEIRTEIDQLSIEKKQLEEKIEKNRTMSSMEENFEEMLEATSALRMQQEEEAKIQERFRDLRFNASQGELFLGEVRRRVEMLREVSSQTPEKMLGQMEDEVAEIRRKVEDDMGREVSQLKRSIREIEEKKRGPSRTEADIKEISGKVMELEMSLKEGRAEVGVTLEERDDSKLTMYHQHSRVSANKVRKKEEEMTKLEKEKVEVTRDLEEMEAKMATESSDGSKTMTADELREYGLRLREKTQKFRKMKQELAELRAESVLLGRTEVILKSKDERLEMVVQKLEEERGVQGYREMQTKLVKASEETEKVDKEKESTLEEMSVLVKEITFKLKEKKAHLKPLAKERTDLRRKALEIEHDYNSKKEAYDSVAVGLEMERQGLEQECDAYQEETISEESRFHQLNCLISIVEAQLEKVEKEEMWENGKGQLLPDFKSLQDLYEHKISQQKMALGSLRSQERDIKENMHEFSRQKQIFSDLHVLLECKANAKKKSVSQERMAQNAVLMGQTMNRLGMEGPNIMTVG